MTHTVKVALSGSGFRLPAHVGAITALIDHGYRITEIAGTSGGAIVAALYASGMPIYEMRNLALTYDWRKLLSLDLISGVRHGAYCSGNALLEFLKQKTGYQRFGDLKIPLKIIASDLKTGAEVCLNVRNHSLMSIALAARASASIPLVYAPIHYMNYCLVDGGCCNNIPVDHLSQGGLRVGICLTSGEKMFNNSMSTFDVIERSLEMMLNSNESIHEKLDKTLGATIINIPTGYAGSLDRNMSISIRRTLFTDAYLAVAKRIARGA